MDAHICRAPEAHGSNWIDTDLHEDVVYEPRDVVIAETSGKAKRLFFGKYERDYVEFTDVRCRKLREEEGGPARIVEGEDPRHDPLWAAVTLLEYCEEERADAPDDHREGLLDELGHELIATFGDLD